MATDFTRGDRVMVTEFETEFSCNLAGFYGHVRAVGDSIVDVVLIGCIAGAPDAHQRESVCDGDSFPFFPRELEHAD